MLRFCIILMVLIILVSCSGQSDEVKFSTPEEALRYGIDKEKSVFIMSKGLSDDKIILFRNQLGAISLAAITEHDATYKWSKFSPYYDIEAWVVVNYESENHGTTKIMFGEVHDPSIEKVQIEDGSGRKEAEVVNGYYMVVGVSDGPYRLINPQ